MKSLLLGHFLLFSLNAYAVSNSCIAQKIYLDGTYNGGTAPLLDQWSEASGTFSSLHIRDQSTNKRALKYLEFTFAFAGKNPDEIKRYPLKKNRTTEFNFEKKIKEFKARPTQLIISVHSDKEKICEQEVIIVEQEPQDGVLKYP